MSRCLRHTARASLAVLLFLFPLAQPVSGQLLRGRVIHAGTGAGIPDVAVLLLSDTTLVRAVITDSLGAFEIELPRTGRYRISASRAGYRAVGPAPFTAPAGRVLDVVVRMADDIVVLDPLDVRARPMALTTVDRARERIERNRSRGIGTHITRAEIEAGSRNTLTDLLAGQRAQQWRGCRPALYIDGALIADYTPDLDVLITPDDIEAVEMYSGPVPRAGFQDRAGCGLLLVWSRRDTRPRQRLTWIGSGVIVGFLTIIYLGW
jgi:hypothetical protein